MEVCKQTNKSSPIMLVFAQQRPLLQKQ